ncbi:MAG: terminase small subunit [archaeon]|nr:terminase small subunit [archaeon]
MPRKTKKKSNQPKQQRRPTNIPPSINTELSKPINRHHLTLTDKQLKFCQFYITNGRNAKKAYISAGYDNKNPSVAACTLLKHKKVKAYIEFHFDKEELKFDTSLKRIKEETAKLAYGNSQDLYNCDTGELIPIHKLPRHVAASIAGIKHTDIKVGKGKDRKTIGHTTEIKTSDKIAALKFLASFHDNAPAKKHKHEVSGPDGNPIQTESVKIFIPENTRNKE